MARTVCLRTAFGVCQILFCNLLSGQFGPAGKTPGVSPEVDPTILTPIFVTGNVTLEGGTVPPEPIAIQRVCGGSVHREGSTDAKGQFQIELGRKIEQDSSEDDSLNGSPQQLKTQPGTPQQMKTYGPNNVPRYDGCELRASLPGYRSTSVQIPMEEHFGQLKVGTIVLTRMQNVEGATISMTSMSAPKEARQAYEKARKAQSDKKLAEAEKELNKAVELYPQYAAAWFLLGEIHRAQKQPDLAIKEYTQSTTSDPQYVSPYFGLALIATDQKRWTDVQHITEQIIRLNSFAYPLAYLYNGAASFYLGQIDVAEQSARKFESIDTGHHNPGVFLLLAEILEAKHDYAGAAQELRSYLAIVPAQPRAAEAKTNLQRLENLVAEQQK